jgi:alkylhydroperoxidase/carboxymuconolactone decarboxylase family protein YurZ
MKEPAMTISAAAQQNYSHLFPHDVSTLADTDPELAEVFGNFAFDEVLRYGTLDTRTRLIVQLASLIAAQSHRLYRVTLNAALTAGVSAVEANVSPRIGPRNSRIRNTIKRTSVQNGARRLGPAHHHRERARRIGRHMSGCTPSTAHIDDLLDERAAAVRNQSTGNGKVDCQGRAGVGHSADIAGWSRRGLPTTAARCLDAPHNGDQPQPPRRAIVERRAATTQ